MTSPPNRNILTAVIISVGGAAFSYREYLRWDAHWITKT
jgi:hypothetical protein